MLIKNKKFFSFISLVILTLGYLSVSILENPEEAMVELKNIVDVELPANEVEDTSLVATETFLVTKVIDGDTIVVDMDGKEKRVRYIGIDTPETGKSSRPAECYGKEATDRNRELVEGKRVRLEKDVSETDKYGRLLRYVYVEDEFINKKLIEDGFADVATYPPDVKYAEVFKTAKKII
ncbi:MAG: Thermonuclease precursor [Parcubacteria bacterium OLB19]|nr:MAG: Thermonuclease precursor [Parcubacteria bacterium OLB19]